MNFRSFHSLKVFDTVVQHMSFTVAARKMNVSKGAISHQIKRLEGELGFPLFKRLSGGIEMTFEGRALSHTVRHSISRMEEHIQLLRNTRRQHITIGMSTYFASRWLSSRLMHFTASNPQIGLRLQPTMGNVDFDVEQLDMTIRWGNGRWDDCVIELLKRCPAFPTVGVALKQEFDSVELEDAFESAVLLHDTENELVWRQYFDLAGIPYSNKENDLVIQDPNVRVQAVVDGQGAAINDELIANELESGRLFRVSDIELSEYGYFLAYPVNALENPALRLFRDWLIEESLI